MRRIFLALALFTGLSACGAEQVWAPEEEVQRFAYSSNEPRSISLVTVIGNLDNSGAHSGLIINASQRVIFDPAGTFKHGWMPERNDVLFGATDLMLDRYIDYHARETHRVQIQTVRVSPEVAEQVLVAAKNYGAVPKAYCANSISDILSDVPGFQSVPRSFFPKVVRDGFANVPGVENRMVRDDSPADRTIATRAAVSP